ncbi:hypothetical protein GCM10023091_28330 [Ravibacter arvi]|uniref:Uncharacterized protein n=1 Tax=Ravibacter arvi TaxID=2051041 RepID=A0ABP8M1Z8_9BACT
MSYLHAPRLIFTGDFLSDVSTVNNDTAHYNNATFKPNFQAPGKGATNGWWNPEGGAVFDFQNCSVRQIFLPDGSTHSNPAFDPILGLAVCGAEGRPTGKMVDLDPDAQMVSALWCVQLRICDANGNLLLKGDIATTCFRDIQFRQLDGGKSNGQPLGATWTSVMTNVVWGDLAGQSNFLQVLRTTTRQNMLSVNLNPFGYYYAHNDGRFSLGRIIGSIGPYFEGEPTTFAAGRRLYGISYTPSIQSTYFNISNFLVETDAKRVSVDFGASFPVTNSMGTINLNQPLRLAVSKIPQTGVAGPATPTTYIAPGDFIDIGELPYQSGPDWLNQTGGIVSFDQLPDNTLNTLLDHQLILITPSAGKPGQYAIIARESIDGLFVRADNFVQRLDYGQVAEIDFYAFQWGKPLQNRPISITLDQPTPDTPLGPPPNGNPISEVYGNNYPSEGLTFQSTIVTDSRGRARMQLTGNAIHSPRVYIDGQIYSLTYQLNAVDGAFGAENLQVHLRDYFEEIKHPAWGDIADIMIQYSNLYPIMSKYVVNLADPADLIRKKNILIFAFSQDIQNTMHMPVTRDLSETKRRTILNWLNDPRIAGKTALQLKAKHARAVNPVASDAALSEKQIKYRQAVKAKNGSFQGFPGTDNLFENL